MALSEKTKLLNIKEADDMNEEIKTSQMSIGDKLDLLQEVKRMDYQNSLVMSSLEKYNIKFEKLKKEQTELLNDIQDKAENLKKSNDILIEKMEPIMEKWSCIQKEQINSMIDNANNILDTTKASLAQEFDDYIKKIDDASDEFIKKCEEGKEKFYKKKTLMDYFILFDLLIISAATAFLVYKEFFIR